MVLGNEKSSSESDLEERKEDSDSEQKQYDSVFKEYLSKQGNDSNSDSDIVHSQKECEDMIVHSKKECDDMMDGEKNQNIYIENDRQLSDLSVTTCNKIVEIEKKVSSTKDEKEAGTNKKEKIDPPVGEAIISGPLSVCLNLGSQWKRRYLTVVDDCLYIWTSYK